MGPQLTENGVIFSFLDTSAGESEFDIYVGNYGSNDTDKRFSVGINYGSRGCGRVSQHISFADKVNMNSVGQLLEYGIRAIQTYTAMESVNKTVMQNQVTNMSKRQYRIPYLVYVTGTVKTQSGVGVENVTISYCHIDRNTAQQDTDPDYCPLVQFTTDKLGQWQGQIEISNIDWKYKVENFYITAFYNQTLKNNRYVVHTFQPASQNVAMTHLDKSIVSITDTTSISIFGSIQFDPLNMGGGSYFCPFENVPVVMVQGNGQIVNANSDSGGNFTFSVTQSDSVSIYIPDFNGHEWRSIMSVAGVTSADLSTPATFYSYADTSVVSSVHDFLYEAITDDGGHWIKVLEKINNIITVNAGQSVINGVFQQYGTGNVKYVLNGATYNYYKRLTYKALFDLYTNFAVTWSDQSNVLNQDFKMYTNYSDLLQDSNSWQYCDYNMPNVGYPADCALYENANASETNMWTGLTINTRHSNPRTTELWIQVFPNAKPYTTDLIQNGDFERYGNNFSNYGVPIDWSVNSPTDANDVSTIKTSSTDNLPSYCGHSHVLINKPAGKSFGGIKQIISVPQGIYLATECISES